jgi:hypothetical protein
VICIILVIVLTIPSDVQQGDEEEEVVLDNAHSRGEVTRTGGTGSVEVL